MDFAISTVRHKIITALFSIATLGSPAIAQGSISRDLSVEQRDLAAVIAPQSDLKVTAWADRQDDTYKSGDTLHLFVKTNRDAYITVIDIGTSGKVHILFPNAHVRDNRVLAHQVLQIPGPEAPYRIRVGGPAGQELIKVIATTRPDPIVRLDQLTELGPVYTYRDTPQALTRDLAAELRQTHGTGAANFEKVVRILAESGALTPPPPRLSAGSTPTATIGRTSAEDLYRLGDASFYGDTGQPNYSDAFRYFMAAADAGHVGAMYRIGRLHEAGLDSDPDIGIALRWYRKAAELGNTHAMVRIALLHAKTAGPRPDFVEAIRWLKMAASQGDGVAMLNLAKMHDEGLGVRRQPREAARYILASLRAGAWTALDQAARLGDESRLELQGQLRHAGFYMGPLDAKIGPDTRAAMVDFARAGV